MLRKSKRMPVFSQFELLCNALRDESNSQNFNKHDLEEILYSNDFIKELQIDLNYKFKNKTILFKALTHTSFVHEFKWECLSSNEVLEFLGDSILDAVISTILIEIYPHESEGRLSVLRDVIVNESSLADYARHLNLGNCLLLGKGEIKNHRMNQNSIIADAFESVVGAIYQDSDFETTFRVIREFLKQFEGIYSIERLGGFDVKTKLQQYSLEKFKELPFYESKEIEKNLFEVSLSLNGKHEESLKGSSKKKIEKKLAQNALKRRELC